ncbi:non-specific serine/threonine protein kinase [Trifolium repens]|nr:non-specific serine/threonine protein kinase [Trifolium repens]
MNQNLMMMMMNQNLIASVATCAAPSRWRLSQNNVRLNYLAMGGRLSTWGILDNYRILVYEFFTKGSLDNHLFRRISNFEPLSWKIQMKIALDAAKGFAFLHSNEVEVIHGGFKTSKIMIDSKTIMRNSLQENCHFATFQLRPLKITVASLLFSSQLRWSLVEQSIDFIRASHLYRSSQILCRDLFVLRPLIRHSHSSSFYVLLSSWYLFILEGGLDHNLDYIIFLLVLDAPCHMGTLGTWSKKLAFPSPIYVRQQT